MSDAKRRLEEQMELQRTACVGCGTQTDVTIGACIRCTEEIRSCENCDIRSCDYCRHIAEKDD